MGSESQESWLQLTCNFQRVVANLITERVMIIKINDFLMQVL